MCFLESWWDLRWIDARLDAVIQSVISFEVALGRLCDTLIANEEFKKYSACLSTTPNEDLDGTFTLRLRFVAPVALISSVTETRS